MGKNNQHKKLVLSTIPQPYHSQHQFKKYYNETTNTQLQQRYEDLKKSNLEKLNKIIHSSVPHPYQYINEYKEGSVYIDPTSIEYQIDTLYRKLIDYNIEKNMKIFNEYVFNKTMKTEFISFCKENTTI